MKPIQIAVMTLLLSISLGSGAQELSELSCEDFRPTPEAAARFPDLKGACEAIVEREGELYARFTAVVRRASSRSVTLHLPATDHTFTISPESSTRVLVDGRRTRTGELQRGQEIRVYLATSEFSTPNIETVLLFSDAEVLVSLPTQPAPRLPDTASALPALGLTGLCLLLMAGLLRSRRLGKKHDALVAIAMLALVVGTDTAEVRADGHEEAKPGRFVTSLVRTGAIVEKVDREMRELKLIDASGRRFTTRIGPEVENFDQIQPRDRIIMEYLDSVAILVVPAGAPEAAQGMAVQVAGKGQKPALAAAETFMTRATVLKVNVSDRQASLLFEDGSVETIKVSDEVPLERVSVGDEVRFRVTHAVAISVQKVGGA